MSKDTGMRFQYAHLFGDNQMTYLLIEIKLLELELLCFCKAIRQNSHIKLLTDSGESFPGTRYPLPIIPIAFHVKCTYIGIFRYIEFEFFKRKFKSVPLHLAAGYFSFAV